MSISAIGAVMSGVTATGYLGAAGPTQGAAAADGASGAAFGVSLAQSVENLQGLQAKKDELAVQAVTGDLDDIHDYTVASSEAKVMLELTAAVRNKAVDAFTEIMRMQA